MALSHRNAISFSVFSVTSVVRKEKAPANVTQPNSWYCPSFSLMDSILDQGK